MAYLTTQDQVQIYYEEAGNPQGQPMILIHGYGGSHAEYLEQVRYFSAFDYRVISYDLRNHGRSGRTHRGMRVARLGADLAELIDTLALDQVILIGHSMGAATVWSYLNNFSNTNVASIVTIDESPKALNDAEWSFGLLDTRLDNLEQSLKKIQQIKMTVQRLPDDTYHAIRALQADYPFDYQATEPLLLDHLVQDWRDVVAAKATSPHLMVTGGESPLWSNKYVQACQNFAEGTIEATNIPETGHLPHVEKPEAVNPIILDFISAHKSC
ncbi:pimeloyl-ACP methyl ester carboxylesterase [Weissella uvarum]|uniref:alpha/beta fold hydrolase n=1 Tax=Weissella uvarum TaxID=1479233 RepID=UPI001961C12B|nr:alpha/beta hydrolase [Weissella uvarum]MBM7617024.1 pimeloyl-ACP methyl ester carboxylesterase [Weissella uvarum]MCM0595322.1 alpha/beta hydrolase [Weissella uvarum]